MRAVRRRSGQDSAGIAASAFQFGRFAIVGASGFAVNVAVFSALVVGLGLQYAVAAVISFLVAVTGNFVLNRAWTFKPGPGRAGTQGMRFLTVSIGALVANLVVLHWMVRGGLGPTVAQPLAIALVMPVNFVGNRLWTFEVKT